MADKADPRRAPPQRPHDRRAEIANLTAAIAAGGLLPPLLDALKGEQTRREELTVAIASAAALETL